MGGDRRSDTDEIELSLIEHLLVVGEGEWNSLSLSSGLGTFTPTAADGHHLSPLGQAKSGHHRRHTEAGTDDADAQRISSHASP